VDARDIVVFLGPSLAVDEARTMLPARYLGPARCGDVLRARRLSPRAIAIVDGVFARTAAIWHKEILLALEDGISVFGASSMGALRAAELVPFGMVGIGRIFEAYRDGLYTDDDEVALLHGPAESAYRELSEAMVNIRATVAHAVSAGVICPDSAARVIDCAKGTFYQVRSLGAAIEGAWAGDPHAEEPTRFRTFIANGGYVNQKRLDAVELLTRLAERGTAPPAVTSPAHRTSFIVKLHYQTTCRPFESPDTDLPLHEHVALEAAALGRIYPLLCRLAQLMALVHGLADGLQATVMPRAVGDATFSGGDFDLGTAAKTRRWVSPRDLDDAARAAFEKRLARIRAVVDGYVRRHGHRKAVRRQRRHMLDMMRLDDAYRRFVPPRRSKGAGTAHAVLGNARRPGGVEISLYRRIATLWAILDGHLELTRVDLPATLQSLSDEFRRKRGLERRAATLAWRRANDLDRHGYERLVAMDARLALVSAGSQAHALGLRPETDAACWLVDAIRLAGLYGRLESRVMADAVCKNSASYGEDDAGGHMAKAKKKKAKAVKSGKAAKSRKAAKPRKAAKKKSVTVKDLASQGAKSMKAGLAAIRRRLV
jgi:hypothetical protein